ncbi:MAG: adenylyltransferase [Myxococcales bacterium]|nr:adenylyltransferase [Myxococcales bacterium]
MASQSPSPNKHLNRFRRHWVLEGWGPEGQRSVQHSKALVVGCGGLGAPVIQYLAAAGIGELTLVDDDRVQESNLNRQILFGPENLEAYKVEGARDAALRLYPDANINILQERVATHNARKLIAQHDIVFDCTDGLPNKYLLNDACVLEGVPLVHGAVSAWAGQLLCVEPGESGCLRCVFPEVPSAAIMPTCQSVGVLGASCGVVGTQMALFGLKRMVPDLDWPAGRLWAMDFQSDRKQELQVRPNDACPVCGPQAHIDAQNDADYQNG